MEAEENEQPELVAVEEAEIDVSESEGDGAGGAAGDQDQPETPNTARRFLPSSIGLTVLLPPGVAELEALITWGDYRTEPPLPESVLSGEEETRELGEDGKPIRRKRPNFDWVRVPKERSVKLRIVEGRGPPTIIPESGCEQRPGGGLQLETHARTFTYKRADGTMETVRAVTVFLVNRRNTAHRYHADVSYAFQARLELVCERGFCARRDGSAPRTSIAASQTSIIATFAITPWDETQLQVGTPTGNIQMLSRTPGPIRCRPPKLNKSLQTKTQS